MRVNVIRCACGFEARALMAAAHAFARLDQEAWRKRCLEAHRARGPLTCRRFLEAVKAASLSYGSEPAGADRLAHGGVLHPREVHHAATTG